ncbi:hypothetical protein KIH23_10025 [Flavobacterium sp. CYK-55]|uniref:hypothetical protein n=1 Tax=Flavobacterium sp. CYK-55 TaxID=2835529 RepID=UPI001BCE8626|nr:hypothetical protein [Flavobacterium sp. CYK-55]MBS7787634.1 hypothetical protein [Flavobacterium sp. CYK-55]
MKILLDFVVILETNFSPISFFNLEKTLEKLCVKIGTKTLCVNSAKKKLLRNKFLFFSSFALKQFRRNKTVRENWSQTLNLKASSNNSGHNLWLDFLSFMFSFHVFYLA